MSLVPDYGSDSETSDQDEIAPPREESSNRDEVSETAPTKPRLPSATSLGFFGEIDEDDDDEDQTGQEATTSRGGDVLPHAAKVLISSNPSDASVFRNRYREAEAAESAVIQKHVKVTESRESSTIINGKRVCWNYRRGRCRFGSQCKYAHDDVEITGETSAGKRTEKTGLQTTVPFEEALYNETTGKGGGDVSPEIKKAKKRPGLSSGLVPGKKVMKNFFDQQHKQAPPKPKFVSPNATISAKPTLQPSKK